MLVVKNWKSYGRMEDHLELVDRTCGRYKRLLFVPWRLTAYSSRLIYSSELLLHDLDDKRLDVYAAGPAKVDVSMWLVLSSFKRRTCTYRR
jgi:hypothetical protein